MSDTGTGAKTAPITIKLAAKKASLSHSRLANPTSAAHRLVLEFQEFMHIPDPSALYAVVGTILANTIKGSPVWLVLVGSPGCGKTLLVNSLRNVPKTRRLSSIKGTAALLSGTRKAETVKGASGGILRELGSRGIMVLKDFTSILSIDHKTRDEIVGAFREIYDGEWIRDLGVDGGRKLIWPDKSGMGRIGFVAGCTPTIDDYSSVIGHLGERWLYYRYPPHDYYGETMKALEDDDDHQTNRELADRMEAFIETLGVEWDADRRSLTKTEKNRILAMGSLMVRVRSSPKREARTREIMSVPTPEAPQRMTKSLGQLYLGLEVMGLSELECWEVVEKVAIDSAPLIKGLTLRLLRTYGVVPVRILAQLLACGEGVTKRVIDDLRVFGLASSWKNDREGGRLECGLTPMARQYLRAGWKDIEETELPEMRKVEEVDD